MDTKTVTQIILLVAIVGLIGWDIYVAANKQSGDTISEILLAYAKRAPIVAFALGVLFGHLFWPQS